MKPSPRAKGQDATPAAVNALLANGGPIAPSVLVVAGAPPRPRGAARSVLEEAGALPACCGRSVLEEACALPAPGGRSVLEAAAALPAYTTVAVVIDELLNTVGNDRDLAEGRVQ